jgi:hypothetical protein
MALLNGGGGQVSLGAREGEIDSEKYLQNAAVRFQDTE